MALTPHARTDGSRQLRILIADDEPTIVSALERFLTRRGHVVTTAGDARAALRLTTEHEFDAVLVDVNMPGDGRSVVSSLSGDPGFAGRLVLMTGGLSTDHETRATADVVRIEKPFRLAELVRILEGGAPL